MSRSRGRSGGGWRGLWEWALGWSSPLAALLLLSSSLYLLCRQPPPPPRPAYAIRLVPAAQDDYTRVPMRVRGLVGEIATLPDLPKNLGIPVPLKSRLYPPLCQALCGAPNHKSRDDLGLLQRSPRGRCFNTAPWIQVVDNPSAVYGSADFAEDTLPCFLKLRPSTIPGAGKGVFSEARLFPGLLFGPYTGHVVKTKDIAHDPEGHAMAYMWSVDAEQTDPKEQKNVDGQDPTISNWLRYVNTARFGEEQNMIAMIYDDRVYYLLFREVGPGQELFVYYGHSYLWALGFEMPNGRFEHGVAPPKAFVKCPTCADWDGLEPHVVPGNASDYFYEDYDGSHDGPTAGPDQPRRRPLKPMLRKKVILMRHPMGPRRAEHSVARHPELRK